jgi:dihydrofolate synthase/folylpolyglutamate synthase
MSDKDIEHSILNVIKHFNKIYTTTPTNPRAINADDLAKIINKHKNIATPVNSPITAVKQAKNELENFDALIICGSLYLASEVRKGIIDDQPRGTK